MKSCCRNETIMGWPHLVPNGEADHAARVELPGTIQTVEEGRPVGVSQGVPDHAAGVASAGGLFRRANRPCRLRSYAERMACGCRCSLRRGVAVREPGPARTGRTLGIASASTPPSPDTCE